MFARIAALQHTRPPWAALRPLCGYDEEIVEAADTRTAIALLDRLLVDLPGTGCPPGTAASLTASDRDRLLASVYVEVYGAGIYGSVSCTACGRAFELSFSLEVLLAHREAAPAGDWTYEDGAYRLANGVGFRLPTGADELAVALLPPEEGRQALLACIAPGAGSGDVGAVEEALQALAPLLDLELAATCPECGARRTVPFDVQGYLLDRLRSEWRLRGAEIHRLAAIYGWSLDDILRLPRHRRRDFVQLIEAELPSARTRSTWYRTLNA